MIFVTIGAQEPFDRLIKAMDQLAPMLSDTTVVAQVYQTNYKAKNILTFDFLTPSEYSSYFDKASLIVSHAGMGTIISALVKEKPILVVPRQAKYGETRNDHQVSTAKVFELLHYVHVAYSVAELKLKLEELLLQNHKKVNKIGRYASAELIQSIESNILHI
ncbi:glycosyltransferase [uncultured Pontibacter sp.]|uniref:glycosyltransferase n=1 Tax=uncultured Pontibacter sp. TaxID=453356 RepID=UPI00262E995D|nr:glycosyltransferase [uncultured Pontibacter sp.]